MSSDHVVVNRVLWDEPDPAWVERGRRLWARETFLGTWGNPESEIDLLSDVSNLDAIELGCGTGYVSAWMMRRGARPVGLDSSSLQLETARLLQREFDVRFPLVEGDAERSPFADGSFDFAISEYGASLWCDPNRWIPEAARLLRPGGRLMFVTGTSLKMLCISQDDETAPADTTLHRDHFGTKRFEWRNDDGTIENVDFQLGHGDMIRVLRSSGFEIEDLVEMRAPESASPYIEARRHVRVGATLAELGDVEGAEGLGGATAVDDTRVVVVSVSAALRGR